MEELRKTDFSKYYIKYKYYCEFTYNSIQNIVDLSLTVLQTCVMYYYAIEKEFLEEYAKQQNDPTIMLFYNHLNSKKMVSQFIDVTQNMLLVIKKTKAKIQYRKQEKIQLFKLRPKTLEAYLSAKIILFLSNLKSQAFYRDNNISIRQFILNQLFRDQEHQVIRKSEEQINQFLKNLFDIEDFQMDYSQRQYLPKLERFEKAFVHNQASKRSHLIYNPTSTTCQIFRQILQKVQRTKFIHGSTGIGKSISLVFFSKLTAYIQKYINTTDDLHQIHHLINMRQFFNIPRLYYFNLYSQRELKDIEFQIQHNCSIIQILKKYHKDNQFQFKKKEQTILDRFLDFYVKAAYPCVLVFDQINYYTSIIRQLNEQGNQNKSIYDTIEKSMLNITTLLDKFRNKFFPIIYASSANCEYEIFDKSKNPLENIFENVGNQLKIWLHYQQRICNIYGIIQIIHIMHFEIIRYIRQTQNSLKKKEHIQKVGKNFKLIIQLIIKKPQTINNKQYCYITHHKIYRYFDDRSNRLYQSHSNLIFSKDIQVIIRTIVQILQKINMQIKQMLKKRYINFLREGSNLVKTQKLTLFTYIKLAAYEAINSDSGDKPYFLKINYKDLDINGFQYVNKQHAFINQSNKTIQFFYSAQQFMQITNFSESIDIINDFMKGFFNIASKIIAAFGGLVDYILTTIISKFSLNLTLKAHNYSMTFNILNKQNTINNFEHFYGGQEQINMNKKLNNLLEKLHQQHDFKDKYIGAAPFCKEKPNQQLKRSYQSKVVDCLIVSRQVMSNSEIYNVFTIDFGFSKLKKNYKQKILKAQKFFKLVSQSSNENFKFKHFILAPDRMVDTLTKSYSLLQTTYSEIIISSVKDMRIELIDKQQKLEHNTFCQVFESLSEFLSIADL